jgi:amidase
MNKVSRRAFVRQSSVAGIACFHVGATNAWAHSAIEEELFYAPASEMLRRLRKRDITAVELIRLHLKRVEQVNESLNAIVFSDAERAMKSAEDADAKIRSGVDWNAEPLCGMPITIKDCLDVAKMPTVCGLPAFEKRIAPTDATAVRKLRKAGAVVIGKTNVPPLVLGWHSTNPVHGRTNNPWDLRRSPGGSSSGEAAIIAAGGSPWGIGSDKGGSIRYPAHCTGICGLRPSWGRVSRGGHFPKIPKEDGHLYYTLGPLARYAEDLFPLLRVIQGPDSRDPFTFPIDLRDPELVDLSRIRIAYIDSLVHAPASLATRATVERAVITLKATVASVDADRPPLVEEVSDIAHALTDELVQSAVPDLLRSLGIDRFDEPMTEFLAQSRRFLERTAVQRLQELKDIAPTYQRGLLEFLQRYDAIICPVHAQPALLSEVNAYKRIKGYEMLNGVGYMTIVGLVPTVLAGVVPFGRSPEGLPIGIQVIAKPFREDIALAIMQFLQNAFGGFSIPPDI